MNDCYRIDSKGNRYRKNVGIVLVRDDGLVLWAKRLNKKAAWQFPQGGIMQDESPVCAMYRELKEELGIERVSVKMIGQTKKWYSYTIDKAYLRKGSKIIGQDQLWFLLHLQKKVAIKPLEVASPEFDKISWVTFKNSMPKSDCI